MDFQLFVHRAGHALRFNCVALLRPPQVRGESPTPPTVTGDPAEFPTPHVPPGVAIFQMATPPRSPVPVHGRVPAAGAGRRGGWRFGIELLWD